MNVMQKILAIMKRIEYINKDDNVEFKSTSYKALSEEKVTSIMRKEIVAEGLVVFPIYMNSSREGNITHVDVTYRIANVDDPSDYIDVVSCGDGYDTQDKGPGKAMTYAYKYMWLRTFAIPTGEDPDKISSEELDLTCERCGNLITETKTKSGKVMTPQEVAVAAQKKYGGWYCAKCAEEVGKAASQAQARKNLEDKVEELNGGAD